MRNGVEVPVVVVSAKRIREALDRGFPEIFSNEPMDDLEETTYTLFRRTLNYSNLSEELDTIVTKIVLLKILQIEKVQSKLVDKITKSIINNKMMEDDEVVCTITDKEINLMADEVIENNFDIGTYWFTCVSKKLLFRLYDKLYYLMKPFIKNYLLEKLLEKLKEKV